MQKIVTPVVVSDKIRLIFLLVFTLSYFHSYNLYGQTAEQREKIIANYDLEKLQQMEAEFSAEFQRNYNLAIELAEEYGWELEKTLPDGKKAILFGVIKETLKPLYHVFENEEAGITSRADRLYPLGELGLNLTGAGLTFAIWDSGPVRASHQLFTGRVTNVNTGSVADHATHVAGTMIGTGSVAGGNAKGMAYEANLNSYYAANDLTEVSAEASGGNLLSNHSYGEGTAWPAYYFGKYDTRARSYDNIMYNAPNYLGVFSGGNDRTAGINATGYNIVTGMSCNKNGLTVAAVGQVLNYAGPSSVGMSSFSSWGPTDDGRIKPDISAKGVNTYSATSSSNSSYAFFDGTSMAAPSVTGTLALLQQHYFNTNGNYMRSSTLRGLALHTADEAGIDPGPDYRFGWGLINARNAALAISNSETSSIVEEITLNEGSSYSVTVTSSGLESLMASITWTDIGGSFPNTAIDDRTPVLVNDLDIRITKNGITYLPWKLDPANPANPATKGDNIVDNIEKIEIDSASGTYTITVTHKGTTLSNGTMVFSLVVTGLGSGENTSCSNPINSFPYTADFENDLDGWSNPTIIDDFDWSRNSGSVPDVSFTGPSAAQSGDYYVYTEASGNNPNKKTYLLSPCFDLTNMSTPVFEFAYHMRGLTMGDLKLHISTDGGNSWVQNIWIQSGDQGNQWYIDSLSLLPYISDKVQLLFEGVTNSVASDMALDAFTLREGGCEMAFGTGSSLDSCGNCVGGNAPVTPCEEDCNGDIGGTAFENDCNICVEGLTGRDSTEYNTFCDEVNISELVISPNPVDGLAQLVFDPTKITIKQLVIYSSEGKIVTQQSILDNENNGIISLNFSSYSMGTYIIEIKTNDKTLIRKVLVI